MANECASEHDLRGSSMRRDVATRGLALVFTLRLIGCPDDAKIGPPVSGPESREETPKEGMR